jgi:hypothetical protein
MVAAAGSCCSSSFCSSSLDADDSEVLAEVEAMAPRSGKKTPGSEQVPVGSVDPQEKRLPDEPDLEDLPTEWDEEDRAIDGSLPNLSETEGDTSDL